MALTRDFRLTVAARAQRDPKYRQALFTEAINAYLAGDAQTGKAVLRDLVNATVGFEGLAAEVKKPSKSLHRMLSPRGNPSMDNLAAIFGAVRDGLKLAIEVHTIETA